MHVDIKTLISFIMTTAEIKFNRIIKEGFHATLKPLGFKKKANNFYLQLGDLGQIINIQKSMWGTKNNINFTINTGIFVPEYWIGLSYNQGKNIPVFPIEPECLIRKRISSLRGQADTWYNVDELADTDNLITLMKDNIGRYIIPYFEGIKNRDDLLELLSTDKLLLTPLGKLIVYAELRLLERAKAEYNKLLEETSNGAFLDNVKEYGTRYQLN